MLGLRSAAIFGALVAGSCIIAVGADSSVSRHSTNSSKLANTTLIVNEGQAATGVDPAEGYLGPDLSLLQNFYVRLTQFGTKPGPDGTQQFDPGHVIPYLAKSWTIANAGKTYTFKLNAAKFPDGTPINSAAVKFTIQRDLTVAGTAAYVLTNGIPNLYTSIKTPTPDTLVLNLRQPNADELADLATSFASIVEPKFVLANGGVKKATPNKWMTTHIAGGGGPFTLSSFVPSVSAVAVRNPTFFSTPAKSATIKINYVSSDVTLALQARSGAADITIGMSKNSAASLKGVSGLRVVGYATDYTERIEMVNTTPPFDNLKFREALTYAVDYPNILKAVNKGYGVLMYGAWAPSIPGFDPKLEAPRPYDLTKAKALLKASGVTLPVTVQLAVENDNAQEQQIATIVQSEWKSLGVNVQINKLSPADLTTAVGKWQYPLVVLGNSPAVYSALYDYGYDQKCGSPYNTQKSCDKVSDALAAKALLTTNPATKRALLNQIVKRYNAQSPLISLYTDENVDVLGKRVTSYTWSAQSDFRNWG